MTKEEQVKKIIVVGNGGSSALEKALKQIENIKTLKPVVSQSLPAQPELLTDEEIKEEISFHIKMVLEGVASCLSHFERVDYQKVAEVAAIDILAKCRQSEAAIRADQNKKIGEWGNEPCPHRNNDFPFPKAVPSELQMPKRECRDCWQEKSGVAKLQKGEEVKQS